MNLWSVTVEVNGHVALSILFAPLDVALHALGTTLTALPKLQASDNVKIDLRPR